MKENGKEVLADAPLLEIRDLIVHYEMDIGVVEAVNNISLTIGHGETLGLIGETGAGKTTVAKSIMQLLPKPRSHVIQGSVLLDGEEVLGMPRVKMEKIRGRKIGMIFQDPMTALNPVMPVGQQVAEVIALHQENLSKKQAAERALEMLVTVGITPERFKEYPHQFSGGMKQRIVIAMALACQPELIIADEPTTALDVTIQAQVLDLMKELKTSNNTAMLLITHDFGVVAEICDKCAVMYAGEIVEYGNLADVFDRAMHPYTKGLFDSLPSLDDNSTQLKPIPGLMPDPMDLPKYCTFSDRCAYSCERCVKGDPQLTEVAPGHFVKCFLAADGEQR